MADHRELYDPAPDHSNSYPQPRPHTPDADPSYSFSAVPLSPGLPSHPIAPDQQAYLPAPVVHRRPSFRSKERSSFLDEILPTPSAPVVGSESGGILRRTGAVGIIAVFILVATWLAATDTGNAALGEGTRGLRNVFGTDQGRVWTVQGGQQEVSATSTEDVLTGIEEDIGAMPDFDQYIMLRTIPANLVEVSGHGRRVIFLGDVHGSYAPLKKLMSRLKYSPSHDTLIHVGDLIAKGSRHSDVLDWFGSRKVLGVRGNHDQPVIQWRAWMEWTGGDAYESLMSELEGVEEKEAERRVKSMGRSWPKGWEWKGEHWHIAKKLTKSQYAYLQQLPLQLHIPSLHTLVVHAGLLPANPLRDPDHPSQPLVAADRQAQSTSGSGTEEAEETELRRTSEEISILLDIPQNTHPWNLINMRGLHEKGSKQGKVTKNGKKGTPWSQVWKREMARCIGDGAGLLSDIDEEGADESSEEEEEKRELAGKPADNGDPNEIGALLAAGGVDDAKLRRLRCSPVSVIYGHAAARGLDIKPFSKGIDTGCVYGRQLTALVLGETSGLDGKKVRVGEHRGVLVSVPCDKGGL